MLGGSGRGPHSEEICRYGNEPFGHGLSYTTFDYGNLRLSADRLAPGDELKGFAKVSLAPGETTSVTLSLTMRSLAYFDDAQSVWVADAGRFEVLVGRAAADIRARASFLLTAEWIGPR